MRLTEIGPMTWLRGLRSLASPTDAGTGATSDGTDAGSPPAPPAGDGSTPSAEGDDGSAELDWSAVPELGPTRRAPKAAREASEDEDDDSDLEIDPSDNAPLEDRVKKLAGALSKAKKKLRKARSVAESVRGVNLDDLRFKARSYESLEEQIQRNPRLRGLLYGDAAGESPSPPSRRPSPVSAPDTDWTATSLPYDPEANDVNRHMARRDRDLHELQRTVASVLPALDRLERLERELGTLGRDLSSLGQRELSREEVATKGRWKAATEHALRFIPDAIDQRNFKELIARDYLLLQRQGRAADPRQVVEGHFAAFKQAGRVRAIQRRPGDATAQRMAEGNRLLPRAGAVVGGVAAPARDKANERITDVHRRVLGRLPGR